MVKLTTKRLSVRSLRAEDAEPLAQLWTDPEVTRYMGGPRDLEQLRQIFLEDARLSPPHTFDLWPVIEQASGRVIGHCGLLEKVVDGTPEIELVYVLARDTWGQGYATEAAAAIRDYGFEQLGLARLIALIDPKNDASARVAARLGFCFEKETVRPGGKSMRVFALTKSTREPT